MGNAAATWSMISSTCSSVNTLINITRRLNTTRTTTTMDWWLIVVFRQHIVLLWNCLFSKKERIEPIDIKGGVPFFLLVIDKRGHSSALVVETNEYANEPLCSVLLFWQWTCSIVVWWAAGVKDDRPGSSKGVDIMGVESLVDRTRLSTADGWLHRQLHHRTFETDIRSTFCSWSASRSAYQSNASAERLTREPEGAAAAAADWLLGYSRRLVATRS